MLFSGLSVKTLEDIKMKWDSFGSEFDAFSSWISEKEKELDSIKSSNEPLEQQIRTAKVRLRFQYVVLLTFYIIVY